MDITNKIALKNRPYSGELNSGDKTLVKHFDLSIMLCVIDAVGHGQEAHNISFEMASFIEQQTQLSSPEALLNQINEQFNPSLGASIGIAVIDSVQNKLCYAGIGNINAYIFGHEESSLFSKDGTVGRYMRTPIGQSKKLSAGDLVIIHSDGIKSKLFTQCDRTWLKQTPNDILNYIFTDFDKKHDDASCIVYRH